MNQFSKEFQNLHQNFSTIPEISEASFESPTITLLNKNNLSTTYTLNEEHIVDTNDETQSFTLNDFLIETCPSYKKHYSQLTYPSELLLLGPASRRRVCRAAQIALAAPAISQIPQEMSSLIPTYQTFFENCISNPYVKSRTISEQYLPSLWATSSSFEATSAILCFGLIPRNEEKMPGCSFHTLTRQEDGILITFLAAHSNSLQERVNYAWTVASLEYSKTPSLNDDKYRKTAVRSNFMKNVYCQEGVYFSAFLNFHHYISKFFDDNYFLIDPLNPDIPQIDYSLDAEDWIPPQTHFIPYASILEKPPNRQSFSYCKSNALGTFGAEIHLEVGGISSLNESNEIIQIPFNSLPPTAAKLCPQYSDHIILTTKLLDYLNIDNKKRTRYKKQNLLISICNGYWAINSSNLKEVYPNGAS